MSKVRITDSSGNVFEDLGVPDAAEKQLKVRLAVAINHAVEERRLNQTDAAKIIGAVQPDVSMLANYKLSGFSIGRLFTYLTKLHRDVEIAIRPSRSDGRVRVRELEGCA
jgi:predicted XRE-type DNA-binding protein